VLISLVALGVWLRNELWCSADSLGAVAARLTEGCEFVDDELC
jgi:hypothetical protein